MQTTRNQKQETRNKHPKALSLDLTQQILVDIKHNQEKGDGVDDTHGATAAAGAAFYPHALF